MIRMGKEEVIITSGALSAPNILCLFNKFDSCFYPSFSTTINLSEYAIKLSRYAYFMIYKVDSGIEGLLAYYKNERYHDYYIPFLCVSKTRQNKGVGKQLIECLKLNVEPEYSSISLEVNKNNVKAYDFYLKMGFKIKEDRFEKYLLTLDCRQ